MLNIQLNWDPSVTWQNFDSNQSIGTKEEAASEQAVERAAQVYENLFTNNVTVTIDVGWGEMNGRVLAANGPSAESHATYETDTYQSVSQALIKNAQSALQQGADATLPAPNSNVFGPSSKSTIQLSSAEANALGLLQNPPAVDGWIGFNTSKPWTFDLYDTPAGEQSLVAAAEHEISEVLGRTASVGTTKQHGLALYRPMDFFRYSSAGAPDLTTGGKGSTAYFSIDGGVTKLGTWNNYLDGYDLGDWLPGPAPGGHDAYGGGGIGLTPRLTTTDLELMNVIGWNTDYLPNQIPDGITDWVSAGQSTDDIFVLSGGYQEVGSGGTANFTAIYSGGSAQIDSGGVAIDANVFGGVLSIAGGGTTSDSLLSSGGIENVKSGGIASSTDVGYLSKQLVKSGGTAIDTRLETVGYQEVYAGGTVSNTIFNGGIQVVLSGAVVGGADVVKGAQTVSSGGTAIGSILGAQGGQDVDAGGIVSNTVFSGGVQNVLSGAIVSGAVISDGTQTIWAGGIASGTILESGTVLSSGNQDVRSGGLTVASQLGRLGHEYVSSGAVAIDTLVGSGGEMFVSSGGVSSDTVVSSGGAEYVQVGGVASGTMVDGGGQLVSGTARGTIIASGGDTIEPGGLALGFVVSGGDATVDFGGVASSTTVMQGYLRDYGTTVGSVVAGGTEWVDGVASATVISAGTLEVTSGGTVGGVTPVTFAAGGDGTLKLDASSGFKPHFGPIAGFAGQDKIDLSDIAFGNQTTLGYQGNNMSGTLTVSNGLHAAHLLLLGQYAAANFAIASDGHGGTLVTDPPLAQHPMLLHPQV